MTMKIADRATEFVCKKVFAHKQSQFCDDGSYALVYDPNLKRFVYSEMYAHIEDSKDSMSISHGTCEAF